MPAIGVAENLLLTWRFVDAFRPVATARRLRDQLTAHLDAAAAARPRHPQASEANVTP
ncbi:MAG: hypothetical protein ACRDY5_08900 [Acidimicrobiales bacterium]